jgi:NADH-quinone oxidoreductase subunit L
MNETLPWIILFLPLAAAGIIGFLTQRHRGLSAALSIGAIVTGFILTIVLFISNHGVPERAELLSNQTWLQVGNFRADIGIQLDRLSMLMLLIVTGVGSAIHIYSWGYMHEDRAISRFFASLSLFTFSMLGIVLSNNFLQMFIFWELVGVSSYLLIGFWYERPSAADASKKAFLTNRLGDFGFLFGIIIVWTYARSLNFNFIQLELAKYPTMFGPIATAVGLLIFCGAMGKSAQFPLHVWLPDAMEGPTPVSALIHAATMVAAGVFMLSRVYFIFTPAALTAIAWVGGFTALLAALIAVQQNDIKRILAYSTLSQLGYMVMGVGLGDPNAGMFHLTTHAFFKAMLFLGAGSVIHALHHEQDIWKMGGLREKMPITFWTFLLGTLALCGVPLFSGFYSKDEILAAAYKNDITLFVVGTIVAVLTTFYMFRLFFVAFLGKPRSEASGHAHESPAVMTWPLLVLAGPAVFSGFFGIQHFLAKDGGAHEAGGFDPFAPFAHAPLAAIFGVFAVVVGFTAACALYSNAASDPLPNKMRVLSRTMANRFYFDEIYAAIVLPIQEGFATLANAIDRWIIAGVLVRGTHGTTELIGRALRLAQTGNLQTYAFLFVAGLAFLLYWVLIR